MFFSFASSDFVWLSVSEQCARETNAILFFSIQPKWRLATTLVPETISLLMMCKLIRSEAITENPVAVQCDVPILRLQFFASLLLFPCPQRKDENMGNSCAAIHAARGKLRGL